MKLADYARLDAASLAGIVQAGEVDARDVIDAARRAATATGASLNAVAELYEDPVTPGEGGLRGVPILMKDAGWHESGRPVTWGSELMKGMKTEGDSSFMRRLRGAGLTSIGRAATSELTIMATVETRAYGTTHNPWSPDRIPGGSSGGSAAAVAAGIVPIAHGTDGGGSIRMPAACCGVVGMKPSRGLVSTAPYRASIGDLGYEFVLTRSVRDTRLMFDVLAGAEPEDALSATAADDAVRLPRQLTIGYSIVNLDGSPLEPEVLAAVRRSVELLQGLGHNVIEAEPRLPYETYVEATLDVWAVETAIAVDEAAAATGRVADERTLEGLTLTWADRGRSLGHLRLGRALDTLNLVRRTMARFMGPFDAYLTSTLPTLPPRLGTYDPDATVPADWYYHSPAGRLEVTTMVFNCSGQPAISLPLETSADGLPIGIHLAAPYGRDLDLLGLAAQLEEARPWADRLPPTHVTLLEPRSPAGPAAPKAR